MGAVTVMPKINGERLISNLRDLREIGAQGTGVVRPAFSEKDMQARHWLKSLYEEAGLDANIDGIGNLLGKSRNPGPALLIGSHSDTQPTGGWLDGAMGVIYGLETARALAEDPATQHLAVDAIALQDEESRFLGCMGSHYLCGLLAPGFEEGVVDKDGIALVDAIRDAGLADVPRLQIDRDRYIGFLEAHIEQGPHLEQDGLQIGVVDTIVGLRGMAFTFEGQQNHAGTTMMAGRKDAATALYEVAHRINQEFPRVAGDRSVWTLGRVVVEPGAPSIVPGHAELELQFRDRSEDVLDAFSTLAREIAEDVNAHAGASVEIKDSRVKISPAHMDGNLQKHLSAAAETNAKGRWQSMPSGAFHDAGVISAVLPCGLMFIPSIGGISHDFAEDSHDADIIRGCEVFADAAASILLEANA
jgi:beta-ureidopropionase / N-carbamoyl-L-amino-acid hydrolase